MGDGSQGSTSNHYTVLGRLAGGGMADIFLAKASSEGGVERYVVLKRVISERSRDPMFAQMFLDEARLAAQLHHPNIAQVHDIGKIAGSYFFTMEYVHGEDVQTLLEHLAAEQKPLPVNLALYIACGALSALHHAHERRGANGKPLGIVHRDVSPSNVMISFEGGIKLLDFGVAKAVQRTAESHTGTIKGKISYMSPEQCQSATIDRRSDVFALGIVLYEMLTGSRLFRRETDFNTMIAITTEDVPPPSIRREGISPALDQLVLKSLSKKADDRFASAAEMLEAIEEIATREHLTLSGTAMGRFLRELFGEKPEPWLELARETKQHVTLQGESQFDPLGGSPIGTSPGEILANEKVLEQLFRTPTLHGWQRSGTATGTAPGIPAAAGDLRQTLDLHVRTEPSMTSQLTAQMPSAAELESELENQRTELEIDEPAPRSKVPLFILSAVLAGGLVAAVIVMLGRREQPTAQSAPIALAPDAAVVIVEPPPPPPPVDAAAIVPDAPAEDPAVELRIKCKRQPAIRTPPTLRAECARSACESGDKESAADYYAVLTTAADRTAISNTCLTHGIALGQRTVRPGRRGPTGGRPPAPAGTGSAKPVDPCEANPLKCRE